MRFGRLRCAKLTPARDTDQSPPKLGFDPDPERGNQLLRELECQATSEASTPLRPALPPGIDLRGCSLLDCKLALQALLDGAVDPLRYSDHFDVPGAYFFLSACQLGVEGIISKRATGTFQSGRSSAWLKVKCVRRQGQGLPPFWDQPRWQLFTIPPQCESSEAHSD